jgi:hypothetical protein
VQGALSKWQLAGPLADPDASMVITTAFGRLP